MSEFLDNLKNAVISGEFNSDAAKKILEINKLAEAKIGKGTVEEINELREKIEKYSSNTIKPVSEEKVIEVNSEYEKKMTIFKMVDNINSQLAILIDIENIIKENIEDMFSFTKEIEIKFENEIKNNDPIIESLKTKIEEVKLKYNIINI